MKQRNKTQASTGMAAGPTNAASESAALGEGVATDNAVALTTTTTTSTTTPKPMTKAERDELAVHEREIEKGLPQFIGVGNALGEIMVKELWREGYSSFADYALKRWGLGKSHAYRLIDAAKVVTELSPIGENPRTRPINEHQVRPLLALKTPRQRAKAWHTAIEKAGTGTVTGKLVAEAVAKVTGQPIEKSKKRSPWAGLKKIAKLVEEALELVAKTEPRNPRLQQLLEEAKTRLEKLVERI
jgi:hypothetical protein